MLHAVITAAAEEGGHETHNPLIPATYDIVWSLVCFAIIFAVFFYPLAVAIGVGAALVMGGVYYVLLRALHRHRTTSA
jgi:hypothetical protein